MRESVALRVECPRPSPRRAASSWELGAVPTIGVWAMCRHIISRSGRFTVPRRQGSPQHPEGGIPSYDPSPRFGGAAPRSHTASHSPRAVIVAYAHARSATAPPALAIPWTPRPRCLSACLARRLGSLGPCRRWPIATRPLASGDGPLRSPKWTQSRHGPICVAHLKNGSPAFAGLPEVGGTGSNQ
jgi:hypothetical protein